MRHLLLLIFLTAASYAMAQDSTGTKNLNLSASQTAQLKVINKAFIKDAQQIRTDKSLSADDKKVKLQELGFSREDKIKTVLTPDQLAKWKEQHMAMHQMADMHRTDSQKVRAKMKDELGLTNEQAQQLKNIHKDFKDQAKAIRQDNGISKQIRKEKLDSLKNEQDNQVQGVLNADQYTKYKAISASMQDRMKSLKKTQSRDIPGRNTPGRN